MVRAALGTQTVGSVIRPAAYCGVVGFKPTFGLVPTNGVAHLAPSFDTVGWMTRTVADARALASALGPPPARGYRATWVPVERHEPPIRLGRYRSHHWEAAQPELAGVLDAAVERLIGAGVESRPRLSRPLMNRPW